MGVTFFAGKPTLDLFIDGSGMDENGTAVFPRWMLGLGGAGGAENKGSASFKLGDWSDDLGCYINQNKQDQCLARVNATTVSIFMGNKGYFAICVGGLESGHASTAPDFVV